MIKRIKIILGALVLLGAFTFTNKASAACELTQYRGAMHFTKIKLKDAKGNTLGIKKLEFAPGKYNGESPLVVKDKSGRFTFIVDVHARTLNKLQNGKVSLVGGEVKVLDNGVKAPSIPVQARGTIRTGDKGLYFSKFKGGSKKIFFPDSIALSFSCS